MSTRVLQSLLVVAAVALLAAVWGLAALPAADDGLAAGAPVARGSDAEAADPLARQFLRNQPRASIIAAAVDHRPMAPGTAVRLAVEVEMLPGMHVNANPATHEWMIPIEASVAGVPGIGVIDAFYPEARSRKFPYDDEPYLVYEGTFVIGLVLAVATDVPPSGPTLEIVVDYQACNDEACFAPATTTFELPILVAADAGEAVNVAPPIFERAPFPR